MTVTLCKHILCRCNSENIPGHNIPAGKFWLGKLFLGIFWLAKIFRLRPGISFRKGKSWFALGKIFRAKRNIFSTSLLQVKMEKKMEKKKKEPVSYDEVFLYLSDKKYSCSDDSRKRAIRSKAAGFITADGVLITREKNSIEPRRWIRDLETRMRILKSCHHGLEAGHFVFLNLRCFHDALPERVACFLILNLQCFHDAFPEPVARFLFLILRCFYDAFAEQVACFLFLNLRCFHDALPERVACFLILNLQCFHDAFPEPVARFLFLILRCFYDAFAERVA